MHTHAHTSVGVCVCVHIYVCSTVCGIYIALRPLWEVSRESDVGKANTIALLPFTGS